MDSSQEEEPCQAVSKSSYAKTIKSALPKVKADFLLAIKAYREDSQIEMTKANLFSVLYMVAVKLNQGQNACVYSWVSLKDGVGKMAFSKEECQDPHACLDMWMKTWNSFILTIPGGRPVTFKASLIEESHPWRCQAKVACRLPGSKEDKVAFCNLQLDRLVNTNGLQGHHS